MAISVIKIVREKVFVQCIISAGLHKNDVVKGTGRDNSNKTIGMRINDREPRVIVKNVVINK